jgi:hypothetical protein
MRSAAFLALLALTVAGCSTTPDSTQGPITSLSSSSGPEGGGAAALGHLVLHADGARTWMDTQDSGSTQDTPLSTLPAAPAVALFPLDPLPASAILTSGTATVHLAAAAPALDSATIQVTLLVDGQRVASSTAVGDATDYVLSVPLSIPAGAQLAIEVCLCNSTGQVYVLDTTGGSGADVPGPQASGGAAPGAGSLAQGPVTTRPDGLRWIAERTDAAGFEAPAGKGSVELKTVNGNVRQAAATPPRIEARLWARGDTEQQARDRLATVSVEFSLQTAPQLALRAEVVTTEGPDSWNDKGGDLHLDLPASVTLSSADLASTNGGITTQGLAIDQLATRTTNGDLVAKGTVSSWNGRTTNGDASADLQAPMATGTFDVATTNGGISMVLREDASHGVDAVGHTTNGDVAFRFADAGPVGPQSDTDGHVQTAGYASKDVQTALRLASTNGAIEAGDS